MSALEDNGVPTGKEQLQLWLEDLWGLHQYVINAPMGTGGESLSSENQVGLSSVRQ